jgi:hypothetical protein
MKELNRMFDKGKIESKHHTFLIGGRLPKFQIDYFTSSHGLTIYTDGSRPKSMEIEETIPFWLIDLRQIGATFETNIAKHMELIDMIRKYRLEVTKPKYEI